MATVSAASIRLAASSFCPNESNGGLGNAKWVSFAGMPKSGFSSWRSSSRRSICCAAKPQTVAKVIEIVKKQLALEDNTEVTAASEFSKLGADSLDTVEIVMALEEEFGINVDEDSSPDISTVREAADLIEKLVEQKAQAA